jgi:hypothetical protein
LTGLHPIGQFDDPASGRENQREHGVGGRFGQHIRRMREHDAALREIGDIEGVETDRDGR